MKKRILKKFALGLFGIVFALLVGELAARVLLAVLPDPADSVFVKDEDTTWRFRPSPPGVAEDDSEHVNALGFRDREHSRRKPPGTYRVLGVGDSFVFGAVPPARNFLRVAENVLNANAAYSLRTEILLMGCPGYSPEHYRGLVTGPGRELDPDLIVVAFFVGNDVTGIPVRGRIIHGQKYYTGSSRRWLHLLRRSRLWQLSESLFVRRIKLAWLQRKRRREEFRPPGQVDAAAPDSTAGGDATPYVSSMYLEIEDKNLPVYAKSPDQHLRRLWEEAEGYLEDINRSCRQTGVPWLLLLIPEEIQVNSQVRQLVLEGLGRDPARYDLDLPQRRLARWAAAHDVPLLDPLPRLRSARESGIRFYVPNDTHWNVRGNRLVGEMLATAVARLRAGTGAAASPPH
jgi:hypothetical protein